LNVDAKVLAVQQELLMQQLMMFQMTESQGLRLT